MPTPHRFLPHRFLLLAALLALAWPASRASSAAVGDASAADAFPLLRFVVDGNSLLPAERLAAALAPYAGADRDPGALEQARATVQQLYRDAGYELVSVAVAAPVEADGVVRVRVHETRVGSVTVSGNRYFTEESVRAALPALREQESPQFRRLARQLFLANDNPARQVALAFSPGENGTADVAVKVVDERPLKMALGADNTGTRATGRSRATLLATHANLWDAGHEAAASYVTSPQHPGRVRQFGLSYMVPLPSSGDRLQFSHTYSNTDVGRVADVFNVSGRGRTVGLRYHHVLCRTAGERHGIDAGIDHKRYKNTIDFFGTNVGVDVDARPLSLGYQYASQGASASVLAHASFLRNLPGGARNDDATYNASREGATARWSAWRAYLDMRVGSGARWSMRSTLEGQYSSDALISGEQYGLGGARSVRGFPEREASGDRGWRLSGEVISPLLAGQHRLLGFVDGGRTSRVRHLAGERAGDGLMSYGIGWRWSAGTTMYSALDWARVANGTPGTPAGHQALHFSAVWRFI